jgi:hypothetical protein
MKLKMAADQVLKRFSRQIRKEDANKAPLEGVNEYRLEAYATLLFGASSVSSLFHSYHKRCFPNICRFSDLCIKLGVHPSA